MVWVVIFVVVTSSISLGVSRRVIDLSSWVEGGISGRFVFDRLISFGTVVSLTVAILEGACVN